MFTLRLVQMLRDSNISMHMLFPFSVYHSTYKGLGSGVGTQLLPNSNVTKFSKMVCLPSEKGSTLKGKNLLPRGKEQILSF